MVLADAVQYILSYWSFLTLYSIFCPAGPSWRCTVYSVLLVLYLMLYSIFCPAGPTWCCTVYSVLLVLPDAVRTVYSVLLVLYLTPSRRGQCRGSTSPQPDHGWHSLSPGGTKVLVTVFSDFFFCWFLVLFCLRCKKIFHTIFETFNPFLHS